MNSSAFTLITGASEGFGKALSFECARRGMPLVLVALPGEELRQLAYFIERNYQVPVLYYEHDLTRKEDCFNLYKSITEKGIRIRILINNAGMGGTHFFGDRNPEFYQQLIALNVVAPTLLTHFFLEHLQQNAESYILNVSSLAGLFFLPKKQVYGGTKSYLVSFSKSLRKELKPKNVSVSAICPGAMNTSLSLVLQNRKLSGLGRWSVMNPEDVASIAIDGLLQKKEMIIPGFWNRMFMLADRILPRFFKEMITKIPEPKGFQLGMLPVPVQLKTAV